MTTKKRPTLEDRMNDVGPVTVEAAPKCGVHGVAVPCLVCEPAAYRDARFLDEKLEDEVADFHAAIDSGKVPQ